jgi:hypothetical protein
VALAHAHRGSTLSGTLNFLAQDTKVCDWRRWAADDMGRLALPRSAHRGRT